MDNNFEIVELDSGEIALRREGEENAPMIKIQFCDDTKKKFLDGHVDVAKAMLQAGMQVVEASYKRKYQALHEEESRVIH